MDGSADLRHEAHEARELLRLLAGLQPKDLQARLVVSVLQRRAESSATYSTLFLGAASPQPAERMCNTRHAAPWGWRRTDRTHLLSELVQIAIRIPLDAALHSAPRCHLWMGTSYSELRVATGPKAIIVRTVDQKLPLCHAPAA
jgi:hypothetical protein